MLDRAFRLEVWEGSSKLFTARDTNQLDTMLLLADGIHALTFIARNENNASRASKSISFTVGNGRCSVPVANGIHVCSPLNNSAVSVFTLVRAAAKVTGNVYRFELWINGHKQITMKDGNVINSLVRLDNEVGPHDFVFVAYNQSGTSRVTKTVRTTLR